MKQSMKQRYIIGALIIVLLAILGAFVAWQKWSPPDSEPSDFYVPPLTEEEKAAGAGGTNVWACTPEVYADISARYNAGEYTEEEVFQAMEEKCLYHEEFVTELITKALTA